MPTAQQVGILLVVDCKVMFSINLTLHFCHVSNVIKTPEKLVKIAVNKPQNDTNSSEYTQFALRAEQITKSSPI